MHFSLFFRITNILHVNVLLIDNEEYSFTLNISWISSYRTTITVLFCINFIRFTIEGIFNSNILFGFYKMIRIICFHDAFVLIISVTYSNVEWHKIHPVTHWNNFYSCKIVFSGHNYHSEFSLAYLYLSLLFSLFKYLQHLYLSQEKYLWLTFGINDSETLS